MYSFFLSFDVDLKTNAVKPGLECLKNPVVDHSDNHPFSRWANCWAIHGPQHGKPLGLPRLSAGQGTLADTVRALEGSGGETYNHSVG